MSRMTARTDLKVRWELCGPPGDYRPTQRRLCSPARGADGVSILHVGHLQGVHWQGLPADPRRGLLTYPLIKEAEKSGNPQQHLHRRRPNPVPLSAKKL